MEEHEGLTHTELLFTEIEAYKQPKKDTEYKCVCVCVVCVCWFQWFDEKIQDVENEEQHMRKLHIMVESLVNHRKGQKCKQSVSDFKIS